MTKYISKKLVIISTFLFGALVAAIALGFSLGIYFLPVIIETPSASAADIKKFSRDGLYTVQFQQDLPGNDFLHWAEGKVTLTKSHVIFEGEMAPGPDYRLYLVPKFVADEAEFLEVQAASAKIGRVSNFDQFILELPESTNIANYTTVVVWCETFQEFIGAAKYR